MLWLKTKKETIPASAQTEIASVATHFRVTWKVRKYNYEFHKKELCKFCLTRQDAEELAQRLNEAAKLLGTDDPSVLITEES